MKTIRINHVPKGGVATTIVRDGEITRLDDMLTWAADNLRGTLWWSATQFRDRHGPCPRVCHNSRQRHFDDGYWLYQFWFSRKADAALFIIFWGRTTLP